MSSILLLEHPSSNASLLSSSSSLLALAQLWEHHELAPLGYKLWSGVLLVGNILYIPESKTTFSLKLKLQRSGVILDSRVSISKKAGSRNVSATVVGRRGQGLRFGWVYAVKPGGIQFSF